MRKKIESISPQWRREWQTTYSHYKMTLASACAGPNKSRNPGLNQTTSCETRLFSSTDFNITTLKFTSVPSFCPGNPILPSFKISHFSHKTQAKYSSDQDWEVTFTLYIGSMATPAETKGSSTGNFNWKQIWKFWGPNKFKMFVWRLAHNSLANRMKIQRLGVELETACPVCHRLNEDGAFSLNVRR